MTENNLHSGLKQVKRTTVGIIVIGDEILKGSTVDSNSHFMCKRLHNLGVNVKKISVVSDDIEDIAKEVKVFSKSYDWVFTTGGIGPTHDDRTFAGLSKAFDDELEENAELRSFVQVFLRKTKLKNVDEAVEKFCKIPKSVKLIWGKTLPDQDSYEGISFPSFQLHNVISFPGVPRFCELSFKQIETSLFPTPDPFFSKVLFLKRNEIHLQNQLTQIAEMHSDKEVVMGNSYFKTKLITECSSHESGAKAYEDLLFAFQEHVINYDETPWENTMAKLNAFRDSQPQVFKDKIDGAIQTIDSILDEYGLENTSLSFNGGKDCTVLLHLLRCRVDHRYGCDTVIKGFHILHEDEFPELTEFVRDISSKYKLEVRQISGALKGGLAQLKVDQPNIVAVLMGSRSTDPKGKYMKSKCQWTDSDWPHLLRVCPVLDWTYSDVWKTIRDTFLHTDWKMNIWRDAPETKQQLGVQQ